MKILTWNINGIRATSKTQGLKKLLDSLEADIICLQETKITRNLLTEDIANVDGYYAFFSFSRKKGGYSGVVTFCKRKFCPVNAEEGLTGVLYKKNNSDSTRHIGHYSVPLGFDEELMKNIDLEGRAVITEHETTDKSRVCVINVYCPRADEENEERYKYKMNFYQCLEERCINLIKIGKSVIVVGDMNVSHRRIDHCDPYDFFEDNIARKWFDKFLIEPSQVLTNANHLRSYDCMTEVDRTKIDSDDNPVDSDNNPVDLDDDREIRTRESCFKNGVLIDVFRYFNPNKKNAFSCWNTKVRARETNYGTRIDYILTSQELLSTDFITCMICPNVTGSDHCPVEATLKTDFIQSDTVPSICSINLPEVCGKQQGIKTYFFKKKIKEISNETNSTSSQTKLKKQSMYFQDIIPTKRKRPECSENKKQNLLGYFKSTSGAKRIKHDHLTDTELPDFVKISEVSLEKNVNSDAVEIESYNNFEIPKDRSKLIGTWKNILKGPPPLPLCTGHKEKAVLRRVKKEGPNLGKEFYVCNRAAGHASNKEAECGFFLWKT